MSRIEKCVVLCIISSAIIITGFTSNLLGPEDLPPAPRILYPNTENVDLKGKDYLEFKWELYHFAELYNCDFRLYKSRNTYGSNLIFKEKVPAGQSYIKVKASIFKHGEVYTCVITEVSYSGIKSTPSSLSFKVIKK